MIRTTSFTLETDGFGDTHDLTPRLREYVRETGLREGTALVFVPGSTAGITTIEYEPGALEDLGRVLEETAPAEGTYAHNERWGDGNGFSHVRAALIQPDLTVPVADGDLVLGTWQQVTLLDFDNRPRSRKVVFQVQGEIGE